MLLIPSADEEAFVFGGGAGTELLMATDNMGKAHFEISEATDGSARAWVVRLHLLPNQIVTEAVLDGAAMAEAEILHLPPLSEEETAHHYFPFGGAGARPPADAGHVAELRLPSAARARSLSLTIV